MKTTSHFLFTTFFFLLCISLNAQFKSATIGIDGLTCSACSFSTEKSIKKLEFVDSIYMELGKNIATIYFKKDKPVSIDQLAKKVVDAGFAVRSIYATFNFNNLTITNNYCFVYENNIYQFIKMNSEQTLNGFISMQFIGENYMQKKEFKKWKLFCSYSCNDLNAPNIKKHYFITF